MSSPQTRKLILMLRSLVGRLKDLHEAHTPDDLDLCHECGEEWPCRSSRFSDKGNLT